MEINLNYICLRNGIRVKPIFKNAKILLRKNFTTRNYKMYKQITKKIYYEYYYILNSYYKNIFLLEKFAVIFFLFFTIFFILSHIIH